MIPKTLKIHLDHGAHMPLRAHDTDAGLDIRSPVDVIIKPRASVLIDTGVHVAIPRGYAGFMKSKSGLMCNHGIITDGTIDSGFNGSVRVWLYNTSDTPYILHNGDKIAQLVIVHIITPELEIVDALDETERGSGGFGSSGR